MPRECFTLKRREWGLSSVGRALQWHCRGQGFDSPRLHQRKHLIMNPAAKSFDICSEIYEDSRPGYPDAVANFFKKKLGFNTLSKLLELAAGTGKFTDLLVQHDLHPTVTEWLPNMLAILKAKHPKLSSAIAKAESIPFKDTTFEGVLTAQAFHWFANHVTLKDIARVLKSGGYLCILFQERNSQVSWGYEYHKIIFSYPHEAIVKFELGAWKSAFENQHYFSPLEHQKFTYSHHFFKKNLIQRALGMSFIAALSETKKAEVVQRIENLCATHPQIKDYDIIGFPYITHVYWAKVLK